MNEFIVVYEPVTNPKSEICADELIVPATALPLIILLLKLALSVEYDDVDNLLFKELLNALVTKSVANAPSNEDVKLFIEILYVVLPEIPSTKVVSNDATLNAGNSDILFLEFAIYYIIISKPSSVIIIESSSVATGTSTNLPIT